MADLEKAAAEYPDPATIVAEGLTFLQNHRSNYNSVGPTPTHLQVLWWAFPREHWEALRVGSSMNFMEDPPEGITPNSALTPEQRQVGAEFMEELIDLAVLHLASESALVVSNAPLFCVPKPGQPGQWRVIANMLTGGQNSVVANDPVFLNRPLDILEHLYVGGFSAVVDASKFFYQFLVAPGDRKFLGVVHPISGLLYYYSALPMGAANSPALAGRYGLSFLRLLRETFSAFRGRPRFNSWWSERFSAAEERYDPKLGHGMAFLRSDGRPAVRVWVHVDDFMIHGPDYDSTCEGLRLFLDLSVKVGLLCHPKKLVPPTQIVTYVGFEFDTTGTPCLRVPEAKRERAQTILDRVLSRPPDYNFSRLALSVMAGVLESLSEATPARLGHTYLRRTHALVHPAGMGADVYYTWTTLPPDVRRDLLWWRAITQGPIVRHVRTFRSGTLVPNWGDGSGTGTGGTLGVPDGPLQMWMGTWTGFVFSYSSNWKELSTLALTLSHLRDLQESGRSNVRGCTVFYFTDNSTTYWWAQNRSARHERNQDLLERIGMLELELDVTLHVVHVPGVVMIAQGTDGLSRGIWMSPYHSLPSQEDYTSSVFLPQPFDPLLIQSIVDCHQLAGPWSYQHWDTCWHSAQVLHKFSIWAPPPELTRQLLCYVLSVWVESPCDSSSLFLLPRVMSRAWHGLSRCLRELVTIYPHETPIRLSNPLPIPVVIVYIAPHKRVLPPLSNSLESAPVPASHRPHQLAADELRHL
ncbi:MAG: hypothetical protein ACRCT2_17460 [Plesiomonas shigelloides]